MLDKKQIMAVAGSAILLVGLFMPIAEVGFLGKINYFQYSNVAGVIVLLAAIASAVCAWLNEYRGLLATGAGSLAIVVVTYVNLSSKFSNRIEALERLSGGKFSGESIDSPLSLWGWLFLVLGAVLITASAIMYFQKKKEYKAS